MSIFEQQADALSDTARRKADRIADDSGLCGDDPLEHVKQEKAVADMVQRMRGSSKLYEERVRAEEKQKSRRKSLPEFGLDASEVEMSGINTTLPSNPNTARKVYQDLSKDLRALVDTGTSQLENYDTHSKQVVSFYQSALDRRGSNASLTSLTTHGRTGSVASIDLNPSNSTRRTSTAPVESALDFARRISAAPKKRDSGVDEDRARRGSRGWGAVWKEFRCIAIWYHCVFVDCIRSDRYQEVFTAFKRDGTVTRGHGRCPLSYRIKLIDQLGNSDHRDRSVRNMNFLASTVKPSWSYLL